MLGRYVFATVSPGIETEIIISYMLSQVMKGKLLGKTNTTIDENGKFSYFSADMRPVPPGRCCITEMCEAYKVGIGAKHTKYDLTLFSTLTIAIPTQI